MTSERIINALLLAVAAFFVFVMTPLSWREYRDAEDSRAAFDDQVTAPFLSHGVKLK